MILVIFILVLLSPKITLAKIENAYPSCQLLYICEEFYNEYIEPLVFKIVYTPQKMAKYLINGLFMMRLRIIVQ